MRNRIATQTASPVNILELRPELTLSNRSLDRPFRVDMERFFDFTFSFAEALVELEDRYCATKEFTCLEQPGDLEIDVRWM